MTNKCPNCGFIFNVKIKVCRNLIASGKDKAAKRSAKKATKYKEKMFEEIKDYISNRKGLTTCVNDVLEYFDLLGATEGDTIRFILDKLVCEGILSKTEFNCRKGHQYLVNNILSECNFFKKGTIFPVCIANKEEFKEIGEFKEE